MLLLVGPKHVMNCIQGKVFVFLILLLFLA